MKLKRRWRQDGPDYLTGCHQVTNRHGDPRGPGGIVVWMRRIWRAHAWIRADRQFNRAYTTTQKTEDAFEKCRLRAMRAVERWLDRWS